MYIIKIQMILQEILEKFLGRIEKDTIYGVILRIGTRAQNFMKHFAAFS